MLLGTGADRAERGGDFWMAGGPDTVWVCQVLSASSAASASTRLAMMEVYAPYDRRFRLLPVGALSDRIRLAAVRADRLHVFFRSGTHRSFSRSMVEIPPGEGSVVPLIEVDLPDADVLPVTVTSDAQGAALWAVVNSTVARKIDEAAARRRTAEPTGQEDAPPQTPPVRDFDSEFVLVRYDGLYWWTDRAMPEALDAEAAQRCFIIVDGSRAVVGFRGGRETEWRTAVSDGAGGGWTPLPEVALQEGEELLDAGTTHGAAALLLAAGGAAAPTVRTLVLDGSAWVEGASWRVDAPFPIDSAGLRGTLLPEEIVLGARDGQGLVHYARWSAADGSMVAGFQPVQALVPAPYAFVRVWLSRMVEFGLLGLAFIVVFFRRHDSVAAAIPLPVTLTLAPLSARLSAFVIDAALLAGGGYAALLAAGLPVTEDWLAATWARTRLDVAGKVQLLLLIGLALAAYGVVFETAMAATPGKRLLGLAVVGPEGARPGFKAILLRNLLRLVDLQVPPVLLLVVMTVNRQRVGDIIARTVVVCPSGRVPQAETSAEDDEEEAEAETGEAEDVDAEEAEEVRR
ncbi:MAG: RDD family protein [Phycisphaerales bacterium]|nr:MAG: RDD family protein [Phycisphaerales bacterium]